MSATVDTSINGHMLGLLKYSKETGYAVVHAKVVVHFRLIHSKTRSAWSREATVVFYEPSYVVLLASATCFKSSSEVVKENFGTTLRVLFAKHTDD